MDEYLKRLITNLSNNGVYFTDEQYDAFEDSLDREDPYVTIDKMFLPAIKEKRLEQIIETAKKLAATVVEDTTELDENDVKEITDLLLDFDLYREQIDQLQNIHDVCMFWPALLLPAPANAKFI